MQQSPLKSRQITTLLAYLAIIFILAPRTKAENSAPIPTIKIIQQRRTVALDEATRPLSELRDKYIEELEIRRKEAQAEGDLEGVLAASLVIKAQQMGVSFSPTSKDKKTEAIQKKYQKAHSDRDSQVAAQHIQINRKYIEELDTLVKSLTIDGSFEAAMQVRDIKKEFIEEYKSSRSEGESSINKNTINRSELQPKKPGEERDFDIKDGVTLRMCWIPAGEFMMGSPKGDFGRKEDEIQQRVRITSGFWIGKYEVTQDQWRGVMGSNPSQYRGGDLPAVNISWNDICGDGGFLEKLEISSGVRFHLPTEAQWEYAARAGAKKSLCDNNNILSIDGHCANLNQLGWYNLNSQGRPQTVGQKKANKWGLHDIHGNVWEWCHDWYGPFPSKLGRLLVNPLGPDTGERRTYRGGSWLNAAQYCRIAYRGNIGGSPSTRVSDIGFRLVCSGDTD